jgi:hypothetical protein
MLGPRAAWVVALVLAGAVACSSEPQIRETIPPALGTSPVALVELAYGDLGFTLSVPSGWQESRRTVEEGRTGVLHFDPATGTAQRPRRAVDVIVEIAALPDVRRGVVDIFSKRFKEYRQIRIVDGLTLSGRSAFRHEFLAEGLRYDQWWIERTGGTFRITFWAPIEEFPGAGALNDQIITTFRSTTAAPAVSPT